MATTRKKKVSKKKVVKKKVIKAKKEVVLNSLSSQDLNTIEKLSSDVEISRLTMAVEEQAQRNMELEFALMQQKIIKQRELVAVKAETYSQRKEKYKGYMSSIGSKYGLKEGQTLGYNPETGEIVRT